MRRNFETALTSVVLLLVSPAAWGVTQTTYFAAPECAIDNDSPSGADALRLSGGEFLNFDEDWNAYLSCGIKVGPGWSPNALSVVRAYVYDGSVIDVVWAELYWHGLTQGNWDACGSQTTGDDFTGSATLTWTGLDAVGSCTDQATGFVAIDVQICDAEGDFSRLLGYQEKHAAP